ncbi:MAG: DUF3090 family protein [Candidatus Rokuibacteriota bacterium]
MVSPSFDLEAPDRFTAGTVGPPGQRVFYLQAREAGAVVTLKVEKEQISALAEHLAGVLAKLPGGGSPEPAGDLSLVEPLAPAWAIGALGVGYDETTGRFVIVAHELVEGDDEAGSPGEGESEGESEGDGEAEGDRATARFRVSRGQAAAFVERARTLVKAGRPSCAVCGQPMNPKGHVCPRSNGHGRG